MPTKAEYDAAFAAVQSVVLKKIRAEVPSMFEHAAEAELPKHAADIRDISNAAVDAAAGARAQQPVAPPDHDPPPPPMRGAR